MKIICRLCVLLWLVFMASVAVAQKDKEITTTELEEHIYFLASDSLKGRKPGTPESRVAAEYIRDQFEKVGLKPLGADGFQYFDVIMSVEPGEYNRLAFNGTDLTIDKDYKPMPFSANGKLEAEVVFAGFGWMKNGSCPGMSSNPVAVTVKVCSGAKAEPRKAWSMAWTLQ